MSVFEDIRAMVEARSLAVVGASPTPGKFGNFFTRSQLSIGFDGDLYLVNPNEREIMGLPVYPDLRSLPAPPDLVYVTIPAVRSIDVLRECAEVGAKGVVMIAAGFRESGPAGVALEDEAVSIARHGGFRIIGPNCFGIYNPATGLTMLPGHDFTRTPGDVGFISQSGGFGVHLVRQAQSLGIGCSAAVSFGNAADVDESDLIEYFALDDDTRIVVGYLEGVRRGDALESSLRLAASRKDVVLWKVGRSSASRRAVMSHTGSLAGSSEIWDGIMRQCCVIQAQGVDQVLDTVLALGHLGRRPGKRLLIAGGGGGLGTYGADVAESLGLQVPEIPAGSMAGLRKALARAGAVPGNPLDFGAPLIPLGEFREAMEAAAGSDGFDVMLFDVAANFAFDLAGEEGLKMAMEILVAAKERYSRKIAVVMYTRSFDPDDLSKVAIVERLRRFLHEKGIPVFPSAERALKAIALINT